MNKATPATSPQAQLREQQQLFALQVLQEEAQAVARIQIDDAFHEAVELILAQTGLGPDGAARPGSVVVGGLGKSGLVGQKLSATFASTGTPSHFLHPTEAMHGDLGRIRSGDVVLLLSFGGNTEEVVTLATILKQDRVPVIAVCGTSRCDLARLATCTLCVGEIAEACPLNLAPTASTTAMLALGDALALCVSRRRNFGVDDFRRFHPGGGLGRQLMAAVQAMRFKVSQNMPTIAEHVTVEEAYNQAQQFNSELRRPGALITVDSQGRLAGIFTDGDLRRMFIKHGSIAWRQPIRQFMTRNPRRLQEDALVRDAVQMVREFRINEIPVVDAEQKPLGLIDVQDLVALKVIDT